MTEQLLTRCKRKRLCVLAWPEGCPYWTKNACPTLAVAASGQEYEDVAAGDPDHDWRLFVHGPLSDYTYQRQGEGQWMLVAQGRGFA